eukprot:3922529-Rhodomonas_salina.2
MAEDRFRRKAARAIAQHQTRPLSRAMRAQAGELSAASAVGTLSAATVVSASASLLQLHGRSSAARAGISAEAGESLAVRVVCTSSAATAHGSGPSLLQQPVRSSAARLGISVQACIVLAATGTSSASTGSTMTRATVVALPNPANVRSPPDSVRPTAVESDAEGESEDFEKQGQRMWQRLWYYLKSKGKPRLVGEGAGSVCLGSMVKYLSYGLLTQTGRTSRSSCYSTQIRAFRREGISITTACLSTWVRRFRSSVTTRAQHAAPRKPSAISCTQGSVVCADAASCHDKVDLWHLCTFVLKLNPLVGHKCLNCKRLKLACDSHAPRCLVCALAGRVCEYDPNTLAQLAAGGFDWERCKCLTAEANRAVIESATAVCFLEDHNEVEELEEVTYLAMETEDDARNDAACVISTALHETGHGQLFSMSQDVFGSLVWASAIVLPLSSRFSLGLWTRMILYRRKPA